MVALYLLLKRAAARGRSFLELVAEQRKSRNTIQVQCSKSTEGWMLYLTDLMEDKFVLLINDAYAPFRLACINTARADLPLVRCQTAI